MQRILRPKDTEAKVGLREEDGTGFTRAAEIVEALEHDAFDLAFKHSGRVRRA